MEILIFIFFAILAAYLAGGKEWFIAVGEDLKMCFSSSGLEEIKKENHDRHFLRSGFYAFLIIGVGYWFRFTQFAIMNGLEVWLLFLLLGFFGNAAREGFKQWRGGKYPSGENIVPFSWRDCRFGSYGAGLAAVIAFFIIRIIIHIIVKN